MLVHVSEKCVRFSDKNMHEKERPNYFQPKLADFYGLKMQQIVGACFRKVRAISKLKNRQKERAALEESRPRGCETKFRGGGSLLSSGKAGESILIGREVDGLEKFDTVFSDIIPNHPVALVLQLIHVDIG